jgi:hypothetical protein
MSRFYWGLFALATITASVAATPACSSDDPATAVTDAGAPDAASEAAPAKDSGPGEPEAAPGCGGGTAPDPVDIVMTVIDPPSPSAKIEGATVDVVKRSDRSVIMTATSDANGKATLSVPTGGLPLDALIRVVAAPPEGGTRPPLVIENQYGIQSKQEHIFGAPATSLISNAASGVGVTYDPSKTLVQVHVGDCLGNGFTGATIAIEGGTVFYSKGGPMTLDASLTATGLLGLGAAFNLPPGPTKITVTYQGATTTHEITAVAGDFHFVFVKP